MSNRARKILEELLEGATKLDRGNAKTLLKYLGFKVRTTGSHWIYSHPQSPSHVNWPYKKTSEPVKGYELTQLRDAVNAVLDANTETKAMPAVAIKEPPTIEAVPESLPEKEEIRINATFMPDEVAELVNAYARKEMTGPEVVALLNGDGYRTATGLKFTTANISSLTFNNKYIEWIQQQRKTEEDRAMQLVENKVTPLKTGTSTSVVVLDELPGDPVVKPAAAPAMDLASFLQQMQDMVAENQRLKDENQALKATITAVQAAVCGR